MKYNMKDIENYYKQLIGFKITGFQFIEDENCSTPFPNFYLYNEKTGENAIMELSMDEEGNGGGFAFLDFPNAKQKTNLK